MLLAAVLAGETGRGGSPTMDCDIIICVSSSRSEDSEHGEEDEYDREQHSGMNSSNQRIDANKTTGRSKIEEFCLPLSRTLYQQIMRAL